VEKIARIAFNILMMCSLLLLGYSQENMQLINFIRIQCLRGLRFLPLRGVYTIVV